VNDHSAPAASRRVRPDNLTAALPDVAGPQRLSGLDGPVEVWRDPDGVPHARAGSLHDAFFAQGFVHAQDRLWHMEYDRRRAAGRWAELVGTSGVAQDVLARRLGLVRSARADYDGAASETRAMLDAYAAGVNAFTRTTRTWPVEFELLGARPEPWAPWDSLAVFKIRHVEMGPWQMKLWRARLIRQLGPRMAAHLSPGPAPAPMLIIPPGAEYHGAPPAAWEALSRNDAALAALAALPASTGGSNSWAVGGARTASGRPLVAGDPHRALDTPNCYYQNHIACPEFDAIGLSFPGVPGLPHFGHNRDVAWCVTHAMADYQDVFVERFDPTDPTRYDFRGEWRRAEVRRETIEVRGGQPVDVQITVTHHGPVVLGDPAQGHAVALRYTATAETNRTFDALVPMLRAASASELEAAMRPWVDPGNNFVFADVHGAIGYRTRGVVPVRDSANAWLPVAGWDGAHEWTGAIPFEEMPAMRDPAAGWIATANSRIADDDYPHYIALDYAPDFRTRRVVARLRDLRRATAADMAAIHADRVSIPARALMELMHRIEPLDAGSRAALAILRGWDGAMDPDSAAAAIYAAFRGRLVRDVLAPLLGPLAGDAFARVLGAPVVHVARLRGRLAEWIREDDRSLLAPGDDWGTAMARALAGAVAGLREALGPDPASWTWGRLHVTRPRHPLSATFPAHASLLDPPATPAGGDGDTVQAAEFIPGAGFELSTTSVARYVFDLGDWERSAWIVPLGASGHPGSPHYADQSADWAAVRLRPMRYDWARVSAEAESHQRLDPAPSR
jgi:penicillin amidase